MNIASQLDLLIQELQLLPPQYGRRALEIARFIRRQLLGNYQAPTAKIETHYSIGNGLHAALVNYLLHQPDEQAQTLLLELGAVEAEWHGISSKCPDNSQGVR